MLKKEDFFKIFNIEQAFEQSGLSWDVLEEIYDNYKEIQKNIFLTCKELEEYFRDGLSSSVPIHSIRCRPKDPLHLIEKIIRKRGIEQNKKYKDINKNNYLYIVRDLIGMRVLTISKEEWEKIFDWIMLKFPDDQTLPVCMAESPIAYTRYGDRDIYEEKITKEHSNKGYRSQHYVIKFNSYYCEIQVRTLAEEVYGEFDHRVRYPYRNDNKFLIRYSNTLSQMTHSIDELISTCFQIGAIGWDECNQYFAGDKYIDWEHTDQKREQDIISSTNRNTQDANIFINSENVINIAEYSNHILLRKDR